MHDSLCSCCSPEYHDRRRQFKGDRKEWQNVDWHDKSPVRRDNASACLACLCVSPSFSASFSSNYMNISASFSSIISLLVCHSFFACIYFCLPSNLFCSSLVLVSKRVLFWWVSLPSLMLFLHRLFLWQKHHEECISWRDMKRLCCSKFEHSEGEQHFERRDEHEVTYGKQTKTQCESRGYMILVSSKRERKDREGKIMVIQEVSVQGGKREEERRRQTSSSFMRVHLLHSLLLSSYESVIERLSLWCLPRDLRNGMM